MAATRKTAKAARFLLRLSGFDSLYQPRHTFPYHVNFNKWSESSEHLIATKTNGRATHARRKSAPGNRPDEGDESILIGRRGRMKLGMHCANPPPRRHRPARSTSNTMLYTDRVRIRSTEASTSFEKYFKILLLRDGLLS